MVAQRAELGKNFGVVLVPEGLVEFMHDVSALIAGACRLPPVPQPCPSGWSLSNRALPHPHACQRANPLPCPASAELNEMLAKGVNASNEADVAAHLTQESADVSGETRQPGRSRQDGLG